MEMELGTAMGKMFGKECLKNSSGKAFAAFFKDAMVFKVGHYEASGLKDKYPGSENWDPSGKNRPMKDWLLVPAEFHSDWQKLATQSMHFVNENN